MIMLLLFIVFERAKSHSQFVFSLFLFLFLAFISCEISDTGSWKFCILFVAISRVIWMILLTRKKYCEISYFLLFTFSWLLFAFLFIVYLEIIVEIFF